MSERLFDSYLDSEKLPYHFCAGCGHGAVLEYLNAALVKLQLDPQKTVIVTDIGCAGLSDRYFITNALHGLHGRSVTYATGMKLANPELKVIVLIGDGGCGIGGHHLINAARRNIGVTVLVFNNFNYGMTGGQHSVTTLQGANTATTRYGSLEQPMDICATVSANGASYVARSTTFDKNLPDMIVEAIQNDGFSVIDIWELCTAYFAPANRFSRKILEESLDALDFATGVIHYKQRREYSQAYRAAVADLHGTQVLPPRVMAANYKHGLGTSLRCVIAGAAGMRIGTAAEAFSLGGVLSGLWVHQRDDYPVTVRSGYSISEVTFSPEEILFPGEGLPDILLALFPEGLKQTSAFLPQLSGDNTLYISVDLLPVDTAARVVPMEMSRAGKKVHWSIAALAAVLKHSGLYPLEAYREAVALNQRFAQENLGIIEAGDRVIDL